MATTKIMRSKIMHYLNVGTSGSPSWKLINEGVSSLTTNFNPEWEEEAGIADTAKTKYTTGLGTETTFDMNRVKGDGTTANDKIFTLVWGRKVGVDATLELLTVNRAATPVTEDQYPAIKDTVNVIYNSIGDEAVKPLKIAVVLGHQGDPVTGLYDVSAGTFA